MARSLERRLYDAYRASRGIRLSAEDVDELIIGDDAVECRIVNTIARELGYEELGGATSHALFGDNGSIAAFKRELKESQGIDQE